MKKDYQTLSEAVNDLTARGYTQSFEALSKCFKCNDGSIHPPEKIKVVEVYRFEGMSSAGDSSVVYALETNDGRKGTLVDSYGVYAENLSPEMMQKMQIVRS